MSFYKPGVTDVQEPLSWGKSTATTAVLEQLVTDKLLPVNINSERPAWIPPRPEETEPNPPEGYVVSLVRLCSCFPAKDLFII